MTTLWNDGTGTPVLAATPVPSTLVMLSILFGMAGVVWTYKRLTQMTVAA